MQQMKRVKLWIKWDCLKSTKVKYGFRLPLLLTSFRSRQRFELWTPLASTHAGSQRHCADPMHGSWILSQMVVKEREGTFACCMLLHFVLFWSFLLSLGFERLCLAAFCMFQLRLDSPISLSYSCRGDRPGMKLAGSRTNGGTPGKNNSETVVTPCNSNKHTLTHSW